MIRCPTGVACTGCRYCELLWEVAENKRYRTIVADPPWEYDSWPISPARIPKGAEFDGRRTPIKYPTMAVDEIAALPVTELAHSAGCHVYLWTTNRYLRDAFTVFDAWRVRFSQLLIWAKKPMGLGPGGTFAQSAEFILFGRLGSVRHLRRVDSVWFNWPRTGVHSKKPEAFLDLVESVSPGPYLELFARRQRLGWDTYGDEALNHLELSA